jgi:bifunctional NMN adenylyltransferase/nudix hydrolase
VSQLHNGRLIVAIAVKRTPPNATNPLNYVTRESMVREKFPRAIIIPISDERSDDVWSRNLDTQIATLVGQEPVCLYSGRDGFISWYEGKYPTKPFDCKVVCSATDVRKGIKDNPNVSSREFREGVIYAHQTRIHQTYETVDIALLRHDGGEPLRILLGKKPNEKQWRFPGGFVEGHETICQAAGRELFEETHLDAANGFQILDDFLLDEWRIRNQKGVSHRTFLCVGDYAWGKAQAGDDLAEVDWFDVQYVIDHDKEVLMVEHRIEMFARLVSHCYERGFLKPLAGEIDAQHVAHSAD